MMACDTRANEGRGRGRMPCAEQQRARAESRRRRVRPRHSPDHGMAGSRRFDGCSSWATNSWLRLASFVCTRCWAVPVARGGPVERRVSRRASQGTHVKGIRRVERYTPLKCTPLLSMRCDVCDHV